MLARNLMTAEQLGITDQERDALISMLEMLERGEFTYQSLSIPYSERYPPRAFNMHRFNYDTKCGTVRCLAGWCDYIFGTDFGKKEYDAKSPWYNTTGGLRRLFMIRADAIDRISLTTEQARIGLNNYLTTGEPQYKLGDRLIENL